MGPKRKCPHLSPAQSAAKKVKARYGAKSPGRSDRLRRALFEANEKKAPKRAKSDAVETTKEVETSSEKIISLQNSVIKGYHHYKIRPPVTDPPTRLLVDREYSNIHDKCSCLVWMPPLNSFDPSVHSMLTDEKRQLYLSDIADLPVGHVPRELASCFRSVLDAGGTVYAEACGEPVPSTNPWPEQQEVGGGVVIPCHYIIKPVKSCFDESVDNLKDTVSEMTAGSAMTIVT